MTQVDNSNESPVESTETTGDLETGEPSRSQEGTRQIRIGRVVASAVLFLCLTLIWIGAFNHGLMPPDEGRYGTASLHMAEGRSWIVPTYAGHIHLTKPPLSYWAQAVCIQLFGRNAMAIRVPSLVAGSLVILLLFWFLRKAANGKTAVLAIGGLALTPIFLFINQLAITDPLLNLAWFATLVFGFLAVQDEERPRSLRWFALMWFAQAVGLMVKGPIALSPLAILFVWAGVSGNWRFFKTWKPWFGLPLSALPILAWVALVIREHPDAWNIWRYEMLNRATGTGDHNQPTWFYLPILIAGFFPIATMMPIPVWNMRVGELLKDLRTGSLRGLMFWGVLIPLIGFSMISGKLISYMLPLGAPLAILVALYIADGLRNATSAANETNNQTDPRRTPVSFGPIALGLIIIAVGAVGGAIMMRPSAIWLTVPFVIASVIAMWIWVTSRHWILNRPAGLAILWLLGASLWFWAFAAFGRLLNGIGSEQFADRYTEMYGSDGPALTMFGFGDQTVAFYLDRNVDELFNRNDITNTLDARPNGDWLLLANQASWENLKTKHPDVANRFRYMYEWKGWPDRIIYVLEPIATTDATPYDGKQEVTSPSK